MVKLLAGVGINDANYLVKRRGHKVCPYYKTWHNMINRCYSQSYSKRFTAYLGCTVDESWHYFMTFKDWMETQDWEGQHLDKDLLIDGNKVYSPETCCFISRSINNFISSNKEPSDGLPIGVSRRADGKFIASCSGYIGSFESVDEAQQVYALRKRELALGYYMIEKDERVGKAILDRYL